MMSPETLHVSCESQQDGWRCSVTVGDDADATEHTVQVERETLNALAPGSTPDELVRASFEFLLEREPRQSIMRSFDLPIISRFFADYEPEIKRRLGR